MTQDIVRRQDGPLDFYRTRSTALRGQAARDRAALRTAAAGVLVMAGALGFAIIIPSPAADRAVAASPSQMR
jgi:hypothetical protein